MSNRVLMSACAAIALAGATVLAQDPQTTRPSGSSTEPTVTINGCLQRGNQANPTGTTGTTSAGKSDQFVLANAKTGPASSSTAGGAAGTAGSADTKAMSYALEGKDSDLTAHVGHRIEVTGTIDSASRSGTTTTAGGTTTAGAGSSSMTPTKFKVQSVKMISATCSGN